MTAGSRRLLGLFGVSVIVVAGFAVGWWWTRPEPAPVPPELPEEIQDDEVREVLAEARREVVEDPRSARTWGRYGSVLLAHLFDRRADECFAEASRLDPSDKRWPYLRGLIALKRDPDRAVALLREAAEGESTTDRAVAIRLQLAQVLLGRNELDKAEKLFRNEWERESDRERAALGLGLIALARGEDAKAEQYLTVARGSDYARKKASAQLAMLARSRGADAEAEKLDQETAALADDPAWPDPIYDRVLEMRVGRRRREYQIEQLERAGRYAEAVELGLKEIEENPSPEAYMTAGVNLARMKDFARAIMVLREALREYPDNPRVQYTLALTLHTKAELDWIQNPEDPAINRAFEEVVRHSRRATELNPDEADAYLFWGIGLIKLGRHADAVKPLREAVARRPDAVLPQLTLGGTLMNIGELEEAEVHLENARSLSPTDPQVLAALEALRNKKITPPPGDEGVKRNGSE